jgi:hypothetical protein
LATRHLGGRVAATLHRKQSGLTEISEESLPQKEEFCAELVSNVSSLFERGPSKRSRIFLPAAFHTMIGVF